MSERADLHSAAHNAKWWREWLIGNGWQLHDPWSRERLEMLLSDLELAEAAALASPAPADLRERVHDIAELVAWNRLAWDLAARICRLWDVGLWEIWARPCEVHGVKWCGENACKLAAFDAALAPGPRKGKA